MNKVKKKAVPAKKTSSAAKAAPKKTASKPAAKSKTASRSAHPAKTSSRPKTGKTTKAARPARVKPAPPAKAEKTAKAAKPSSKGGRKKVLCEFCGQPIPTERVEALPETTTCVECSQTKPYSEAQIIGMNGEETDQNRLNVEDFEEVDSDFASGYNNDQW
jgi:hypothetical protein